MFQSGQPGNARMDAPPTTIVSMHRRSRALFVGAGLAFAILTMAGCGGGGSPTTTAGARTQEVPANASPTLTTPSNRPAELHEYTEAPAIVAALATAGLHCLNPQSATTGTPPPTSEIVCVLHGTPVQVSVYGDPTSTSTALGSVTRGVCATTRANTTRQLYFVYGNRWTVVTRSNADAASILAVLGGSPGQVSCGSATAPARG